MTPTRQTTIIQHTRNNVPLPIHHHTGKIVILLYKGSYFTAYWNSDFITFLGVNLSINLPTFIEVIY